LVDGSLAVSRVEVTGMGSLSAPVEEAPSFVPSKRFLLSMGTRNLQVSEEQRHGEIVLFAAYITIHHNNDTISRITNNNNNNNHNTIVIIV
jgi:hypothetical protein